MNLIRIGSQTINLSLVMRFQEHAADPEMPIGHAAARRLELVFVNGATAALEGDDAESMRRYLIANSTTIGTIGNESEFSAGDEGHVFPKAHSGKHAT